MPVDPTEQLEVVTENDEPTGVLKLRSEIHRDGDWHRTAHVYVVNTLGQFLVHLRSQYKDTHPNCWDTRFGGHVAPGVDPLSAAVSEVQEEVGITINSDELRPLPKIRHDGGANREYNYPFIFSRDLDTSTLKFNDGEVTAVRWLSPEQIQAESQANPTQWVSGKGFTSIVQQLRA